MTNRFWFLGSAWGRHRAPSREAPGQPIAKLLHLSTGELALRAEVKAGSNACPKAAAAVMARGELVTMPGCWRSFRAPTGRPTPEGGCWMAFPGTSPRAEPSTLVASEELQQSDRIGSGCFELDDDELNQ